MRCMVSEILLVLIGEDSWNMATQLKQALQARSDEFFKSKAFRTALFLDPRIRFKTNDTIFNMERKDDAIVSFEL